MTRSSALHHLSRRHLLGALAGSATMPLWAQGTGAWSAIASRAHGQTVYFNAWAGSERINAYLQGTAEQVQRQSGVQLEHV
jgi:putative thiamine transport system substrate-binding protein